MDYTIEKNRNLQNFGEITYGTLFLDEDNIPYIKIHEVTRIYEYNYVFNSIRLSTGAEVKFNEYETVKIPNYELKIST